MSLILKSTSLRALQRKPFSNKKGKKEEMKIFQPHLCEGIMNLLENSSSFKQREKLLHSNYDSATVPEELKYESWLSKKIHMKYIHCQVNILEKQKLKSCFSQSFIFLNLSTF